MGWNLGLLGYFSCFHVLELDARIFLHLGDQDQAVEIVLFLLDLLLIAGHAGGRLAGMLFAKSKEPTMVM